MSIYYLAISHLSCLPIYPFIISVCCMSTHHTNLLYLSVISVHPFTYQSIHLSSTYHIHRLSSVSHLSTHPFTHLPRHPSLVSHIWLKTSSCWNTQFQTHTTKLILASSFAYLWLSLWPERNLTLIIRDAFTYLVNTRIQFQNPPSVSYHQELITFLFLLF